jgi:hypothetical protein
MGDVYRKIEMGFYVLYTNYYCMMRVCELVPCTSVGQ